MASGVWWEKGQKKIIIIIKEEEKIKDKEKQVSLSRASRFVESRGAQVRRNRILAAMVFNS